GPGTSRGWGPGRDDRRETSGADGDAAENRSLEPLADAACGGTRPPEEGWIVGRAREQTERAGAARGGAGGYERGGQHSPNAGEGASGCFPPRPGHDPEQPGEHAERPGAAGGGAARYERGRRHSTKAGEGASGCVPPRPGREP